MLLKKNLADVAAVAEESREKLNIKLMIGNCIVVVWGDEILVGEMMRFWSGQVDDLYIITFSTLHLHSNREPMKLLPHDESTAEQQTTRA